MSGRKDYYAALGVSKDTSADEIKRAYRKLARKWHPDVNPGDTAAEERFKEISEAYHVLGDEDRRRKYDQVGPEAFAQEVDLSDFAAQFGNLFGGFRTAPGQTRTGDFGMFEEILGGFGRPGASGFGAGPARTQPRPGRDVRVPLSLTLADIVTETERTIAYRHTGASQRCKVRIPAGVNDGATVRVRGKGESSPSGGPAGDLLLEVSIQPHPTLRRDGKNLRTEIPVTPYEATLGARIEVPTLDGAAKVELPPGSRNGQVLRLTGRGIEHAGKRGDLLARVVIQMPREASPDLKEIMEQFRDRAAYNPRREK